MSGSARVLHVRMTVRQVAYDFPETRPIFERYGVQEYPDATFGTLEPLDRFAARVGVSVPALLGELAEAAHAKIDWDIDWAWHNHRWFLTAAILVTWTLGAGWGAWLLWQISSRGSFDAVPVADVVAHGEAQMWGFVGLFILGIACRYLPSTTGRARLSRFWHTTLLAATLAGIASGFVWSLRTHLWPGLGTLSGVLFLAAASIYGVFVFWQLRSKSNELWARFILVSAGWLLLWAIFTLYLRWQYASSGPNEYSLQQRLTIIGLSLAGFVLNSIYGFGLRLLSGFVATQPPRPMLVRATFWGHLVSVMATCLGWLENWSWLVALGTTGWVAAALCYVLAFGGFRRRRLFPQRPELGPRWADRYIQLAFFWLCVGSLMLALAEVRSAWSAQAAPHAWLGAARHALTVGFVTTLILGVAQRLVPVLEHTILPWPSWSVPIWLCIALGNFARVGSELATLVWREAFMWMPLSAGLELVALILFGVLLLRTMWRLEDPLVRSGRVTRFTPLALLLATHPWLEREMLQWGLRYLGRVRAVPPELTLGSFAESEGWPVDALLTRINTALTASSPKGTIETRQSDPR